MTRKELRARNDRLRCRYRPDEVRVLFIGEAPPDTGDFFYAADSNLYFATRDAFYRAWPKLAGEGDFLDVFERLGCYLEDLSEDPVPLDGRQRRRARQDAVPDLADRLTHHSPKAVVVVMDGIKRHVRQALAEAELQQPMAVLKFPAYGWSEEYKHELAATVRRLRRRSAFQ